MLLTSLVHFRPQPFNLERSQAGLATWGGLISTPLPSYMDHMAKLARLPDLKTNTLVVIFGPFTSLHLVNDNVLIDSTS